MTAFLLTDGVVLGDGLWSDSVCRRWRHTGWCIMLSEVSYSETDRLGDES